MSTCEKIREALLELEKEKARGQKITQEAVLKMLKKAVS
jgi:hypothetical protein